MNLRYNRHRITTIHNNDELVFSDPKEAKEDVVDYYRELLGSESDTAYSGRFTDGVDYFLLPSNKGTKLVKPIFEAKIYEALISMCRDKAPGPDGFNAFFFKFT